MKFKLLILSFFCLGMHQFAWGVVDNDKYVYTINLSRVNDDKVLVELQVPQLDENEIKFFLPKIIPGTYKEADYGRFVTNLKAYDKKGKTLTVTRTDDNTWEIQKAKKLKRITYEVNDTFDADMGANQVYPMAGTNIEDKKNFVFNTSGFFGYFEGMKENEFELNFIRPKDFYGSTGLIATSVGQKLDNKINKEKKVVDNANLLVDKFVTTDYNLLIDSPIMYNVPDTTLIDVAGTEVLVSVYSPKGLVTSKFIAENIDEILRAQKDYLGGKLPVDKYAFIFYCEELSKLAPIQGALEHSYSSFYYFPEVPQENLTQTVKDVAAHEFFHIVTPLNIHSEEIQYFDFNEPKMSKHLWMYEGVTEYSAHHVQVKYGLITPDEFLATMRQKMVSASTNYNDTLSFTDLSEFTLDKYSDQYANVYEKGALIGMVLDLKLRHLSDGDYGVQNLMKDLSTKYGKDKPFTDQSLFEEIVALTYPEIGTFFEQYVINGNVLPYREAFNLAGVDYAETVEVDDISLGNIGIGYDNEAKKLMVASVDNMNAFGKAMGYKVGDLLLQINNTDIPLQGLQEYIDNIKANMRHGDTLSVKVLREGKEEELKASIVKTKRKDLHMLKMNENPTPQQLKIRNAWLKP